VVGAGQLLHQPLGFRIVAAPDLVIAREVAHAAAVLQQAETFLIERDRGGDRAGILDRDQVRLVDNVGARRAAGRIVGVGVRLGAARREIVQLGFDRGEGGRQAGGFEGRSRQAHVASPVRDEVRDVVHPSARTTRSGLAVARSIPSI
jgi:hypothetical protein